MIDLTLAKISETANTVTLGWTPPDGVEWYTLFENHVRKSNHAPIDKGGVVYKQAKFGKVFPIQVVAEVQTSPGVFDVAVGTYTGAVVPPPPSGKVDGVGLCRYAGTMASVHGTYDLLIGDWGDQHLLSTKPGLTFAYRNLGASGGGNPGTNPIDLSNPAKFTAECRAAIQNNPGLDGIFLDNCDEKLQGVQVPFLKAALPPLKADGIKLMLNAVATGAGQNDGSGDARWYSVVGPYATHIMSECWAQDRSGSRGFQVRLRGGNWYDLWDEWVANAQPAAHATGCCFVGMTYGKIGNGIYGRASMLLRAAAGDVFIYNPESKPEGSDPSDTSWRKDLSAPLDPAGSNPRRFVNGTVSVDPVKGTAVIS